MRTIITIGRQYGSGGHQIGKILSDEYGIGYYDKELLDRAAKESGIGKELFENQDESQLAVFSTHWLWILILLDLELVPCQICL